MGGRTFYHNLELRLNEEENKVFNEIKGSIVNGVDLNKKKTKSEIVRIAVDIAYNNKSLISVNPSNCNNLSRDYINQFIGDIILNDKLRTGLFLIFDFGYITLVPGLKVEFTDEEKLKIYTSSEDFIEIETVDMTISKNGKETGNKDEEYSYNNRIEDVDRNQYIIAVGYTNRDIVKKSNRNNRLSIKILKKSDNFEEKIEELNKYFKVYNRENECNKSEVIRLVFDFLSRNRYLLNEDRLKCYTNENSGVSLFMNAVVLENSKVPIRLLADGVVINIPSIREVTTYVEYEQWLLFETSSSYRIAIRTSSILKVTCVNTFDNSEYSLDEEVNLEDIECLKVYITESEII